MLSHQGALFESGADLLAVFPVLTADLAVWTSAA